MKKAAQSRRRTIPRLTPPTRLNTSNQNKTFGDCSRDETIGRTSSLSGFDFDCERWENQKSELYWSTSGIDFEIRTARSGTSLFFRYESSSLQMLNLRSRCIVASEPRSMSACISSP